MTTDKTPPPQPAKTDAQAMLETALEHGRAHHMTDPNGNPFTTPALISVPDTRKVQDFTEIKRRAAEYLKPARRKGTAQLTTLQSLIDWAHRFTDSDHGALFADVARAQPRLICVADYHLDGPPDPTAATGDPTARHCHHRAQYAFPLSDEWLAWTNIAGKPLDKDELGEFLETQILDIHNPTPALLALDAEQAATQWETRMIDTARHLEGRFATASELLALSKRFAVYETSDLQLHTNRDTGEASIQFLNEHRDAEGRPLRIPNLLLIAIPVFDGGLLYRMAVRFRYRKSGPTLKFTVTPHNADRVMDRALREDCDRAQEATALPLLFGTPETT